MHYVSVRKTIVSEELLKEEFVCNISACKGECCVAGDAGAPLIKDEVEILENVFEKVKPYMSKKVSMRFMNKELPSQHLQVIWKHRWLMIKNVFMLFSMTKAWLVVL